MALLRSAARALRLRQPLECQCFLVPRVPVCGLCPRLLSSSVPTERHNSLGSRSRNTTERKRLTNGNNEDIFQRILKKVDKLNEGLDRHEQLLQELEDQIKNNKSREIDLHLKFWYYLPLSFPLSFINVSRVDLGVERKWQMQTYDLV